MRLTLVAAAAAILLLLALVTVRGGTGGPAWAETKKIDTGNLYFCNSSFQGGVCETTATAGDTVTWTVSSGSHTVTECNDSFTSCPPAGGFDSGSLGSGNSFSRTFNTVGSFEYWCAFHPSAMRGRIVVQAQATATPTPAPTGTPGATSPAATSSGAGSPTASPARVPQTGGGTGSHGGAVSSLALLLLGGTLLGAAGVVGVRAARRAR